MGGGPGWPVESLPYEKLLSQTQTQKQLKRLCANFLLLVHTGDHCSQRVRDLPRSLARRRQQWTQMALRWHGASLHSPRSCVSTQRVQKSYSMPGLSVAGTEEAGPRRPVVRQVWLPPSLRHQRPALPLAWPSPGSPTGLAPGAAPPIAPCVTGGRSRPLGKEE